MAWGHVIGVVIGVVGTAVVAALAEEHTERQERREARRQKRWDQRLKDEARKSQQVEEAPQKEAERLRLQAEADVRKHTELVEKYAGTALYWKGWLGREQVFRFKPAAVPEGEHFDAVLVEVQELGLVVKDLTSDMRCFVSFEGVNVALVPEEGDEDAENDEEEHEDEA